MGQIQLNHIECLFDLSMYKANRFILEARHKTTLDLQAEFIGRRGTEELSMFKCSGLLLTTPLRQFRNAATPTSFPVRTREGHHLAGSLWGSLLPKLLDKGNLISIPDAIIPELLPVLCELLPS